MTPRRRKATAPSQEQLDEALRGATRFRVREVLGGRLLLEVEDRDEVASFASLLHVRPGEPFHCMCLGDQTLEFRQGALRRKTKITLHHGRSLRWDGAWDTDVLLDEPQPMLDWLAERGVSGPRDEVERIRSEEERSRKEWEAWARATPSCLEPFLLALSADAFGGPPEPVASAFEEAVKALERTYAADEEAIRALLAWFGQGAGSWNGFPSYERVAERLLLRYPTELIVRAMESAALEPAHLEGAGRLFASWWFAQERPDDASRIPADLAQRLLAHADALSDEGNRSSLRHALGAQR